MTGQRRGGFSLIELLVVIIIIALLVAIIVPSLWGARDAARGASTQSLMTQVQNASAKFETDHHRLPGYFSARQMGMQTNEANGFTAMENAMIDLAGGLVGTSPPVGPTQVAGGPGSLPDGQVTIDTQRIGVGENLYFVPPAKFYKTQGVDGQVIGGQSGGTNPGVDQIPDLVDAWDSPLLLWVKDDTAIRPIDPTNNSYLCARNSASGADVTRSARYYWAANAGFLGARALGKKQTDQTYDSSGSRPFSLIGQDAPGVIANGAPSLEATLGSPNFPYRPSGAIMTPQNGQFNPAQGRGGFIIQSAGRDGYYVGSKERGGQLYTTRGGGDTGILQYGWSQQNLAMNPPTPHTDKDGKVTNIDILKDFDDLLSTGSN
ncbi:MAG: prepilin-type N-terminal cleavage/methylation domain-containing protein [Phycisphaerales bacterium]|nr:prepilin-type N-terminal cleavage/methylation domain-containing protein [Phycisphaerales bacterium]